MIEHLNYCRQIRRDFGELVGRLLEIKKENNEAGLERFDEVLGTHTTALIFASTAEKFLLPAGGRLHEDKQFRALDEREPLRLPFPVIALEYLKLPGEGDQLRDDSTTTRTSKTVCFAAEVPGQHHIVVQPVIWIVKRKMWVPMPPAYIPSVGYLDRSATKNGWVGIATRLSSPLIPLVDYQDEIGALLCFLNVLQCSNVSLETSRPRRDLSQRSIAPALNFDSYHLLTISNESQGSGPGYAGGHRSPREHLRRGHIRVYASGLRTWVNATVVGANRGTGKVSKDYVLP